MNEKRPDAATGFDHAARPNPTGKSRHQHSERPGRLAVIMPEPKENRGQQNRFGRTKDAAEMREKDAAKLKFFTRGVEHGDGDTPRKSPGNTPAEAEIRMDRQVKIGREDHGENEHERRAEPAPGYRPAQTEKRNRVGRRTRVARAQKQIA